MSKMKQYPRSAAVAKVPRVMHDVYRLGRSGATMTGFVVRSLDETTWPDFARLVERHNGVWGGCWCMSFHAEGVGRARTAAQNRAAKECRVCEGRAHAALVYDGPICVGWCQFGPPDELPRIKHRRAYAEGSAALPDWRITCFFVDREYRGRGVAAAALDGALRDIARRGGGTVESYPEAVEGRSVSGSFLHNGTASMFERQGFGRTRRLGKNHWVVTRVVHGQSKKRKV
jgi:GNAT superfamily N-acetyltransferase